MAAIIGVEWFAAERVQQGPAQIAMAGGGRSAGDIGQLLLALGQLALAGCNEAEIATITGHSMKDVGSILDAHYLHRDSKLAESAIHKLERSMETPN